MFAAGSSESCGGCLLPPAQGVRVCSETAAWTASRRLHDLRPRNPPFELREGSLPAPPVAESPPVVFSPTPPSRARDGASRHLLQPLLSQVGRPRLVPHVKTMHYILMVILSVLFVCFATDSWSSSLFYDQECARISYRPPSWVSKPHSNAPPLMIWG